MAYAEILKEKSMYLELNNFYQEKRDYFLKLIANSKLKPLGCSATYFQLLKYDAISDLKDTEFAKELTVKHKLAAIPISVFYHKPVDNHVLRFFIMF